MGKESVSRWRVRERKQRQEKVKILFSRGEIFFLSPEKHLNRRKFLNEFTVFLTLFWACTSHLWSSLVRVLINRFFLFVWSRHASNGPWNDRTVRVCVYLFIRMRIKSSDCFPGPFSFLIPRLKANLRKQFASSA